MLGMAYIKLFKNRLNAHAEIFPLLPFSLGNSLSNSLNVQITLLLPDSSEAAFTVRR